MGAGNGEAVNDNASGTALVMEIARVLASPDIQTERSVRFALWNNEETGLNGARAYVAQRAELQGIEDPPGSGRYPEPRWIAMIQHDKVLYDRGNPPALHQAWNADVDVEFQINSEKWEDSAQLGIAMINANRMFATDFPAALSNAMSNTDSTPFMDVVAAVSVRENRRRYEIGWQGLVGYGARGSDPTGIGRPTSSSRTPIGTSCSASTQCRLPWARLCGWWGRASRLRFGSGPLAGE